MDKTKTRPIAVALPDDLIEVLDEIATREDRSRSYVIRRLLLEAIESDEAKRAPLLAMAPDNGRTP